VTDRPVHTPEGDFRVRGKVERVNVTFVEADPVYELESGAASREVTPEELEYALSIISRWSAPRKAPRGQPAA
jgi:hypothetical protein